MKLKRTVALLLMLCCVLSPASSLAADMGIITADGVNLRESPDTGSSVLDTLSLGQEAEVLAVENGWYRIMLPGGTVGYIRQDYIFSNSSGSRGGYVLDDSAYMRGGPSENTYAIKQLTVGQGVKIKAVIGEWFFVVADETAGYVYRTHLTLTSSNIASGSMLKSGMEGEEVEKLQRELYDRGFMSKSDLSGSYDSATKKAVLEYQQTAGLSSADGIAGAETLNSLYDSTNKLTKENARFTQLKGSVVRLNWFEGGSDWLNKGARFTIVDVRTGKSFRARRFGGWYHADCEPITKSDTAVIKSLEGFSWNRRPIWINYNGKTVAASMHTMPHMANPTQSNGYDGHFCVHLYKSKVHETSAECPRHQACENEAYRAGRAG
ncbi:MAG: SH3 domain-containing protein [Clostridia bacterium]|nr:SH3 domain-containing protein [Clostridia bacterium]MBQ6704128.1 SH3 domain-containing protein [Clostridia bacterium]